MDVDTDAGEVQIPDDLLCPILHTLFRNPVVNQIGNTYDEDAIRSVWQRTPGVFVDPLTNQIAGDGVLIPNWDMRRRVSTFLERHPDLIPDGWPDRNMLPAPPVHLAAAASSDDDDDEEVVVELDDDGNPVDPDDGELVHFPADRFPAVEGVPPPADGPAGEIAEAPAGEVAFPRRVLERLRIRSRGLLRFYGRIACRIACSLLPVVQLGNAICCGGVLILVSKLSQADLSVGDTFDLSVSYFTVVLTRGMLWLVLASRIEVALQVGVFAHPCLNGCDIVLIVCKLVHWLYGSSFRNDEVAVLENCVGTTLMIVYFVCFYEIVHFTASSSVCEDGAAVQAQSERRSSTISGSAIPLLLGILVHKGSRGIGTEPNHAVQCVRSSAEDCKSMNERDNREDALAVEILSSCVGMFIVLCAIERCCKSLRGKWVLICGCSCVVLGVAMHQAAPRQGDFADSSFALCSLSIAGAGTLILLASAAYCRPTPMVTFSTFWLALYRSYDCGMPPLQSALFRRSLSLFKRLYTAGFDELARLKADKDLRILFSVLARGAFVTARRKIVGDRSSQQQQHHDSRIAQFVFNELRAPANLRGTPLTRFHNFWFSVERKVRHVANGELGGLVSDLRDTLSELDALVDSRAEKDWHGKTFYQFIETLLQFRIWDVGSFAVCVWKAAQTVGQFIVKEPLPLRLIGEVALLTPNNLSDHFRVAHLA